MATATASRLGEIVAGRFRITGTIGKGAMGAVYSAEHTGTGQHVALKFMALEGDDGAEFAARFEQEARVMAALRHPNTIRIYDFGRTGAGEMFMAMELLAGTGLDKVIRENTRNGTTMREADAANYAIQILKALAEAHGQGLVHRDLKPGNIMLTEDGGDILCKVLDFGIARVHNSDMTQAGRVLGTPSYMSPEQWQGGKLDGRSDLYAVGCMLYCCVTGSPPFGAGDNYMALMAKHLHDPPPDPRAKAKQALCDGFVQVIATALSKEPGARYADARSMRQALEAAKVGAWDETVSNLPPPARSAVRPADRVQPGAPAAARIDDQATMALPTDPHGPVPAKVAERTLAFEGPPQRGKTRAPVVVGLALVLALAALGAWFALRPAPVPLSSPPDLGVAASPAAVQLPQRAVVVPEPDPAPVVVAPPASPVVAPRAPVAAPTPAASPEPASAAPAQAEVPAPDSGQAKGRPPIGSAKSAAQPTLRPKAAPGKASSGGNAGSMRAVD